MNIQWSSPASLWNSKGVITILGTLLTFFMTYRPLIPNPGTGCYCGLSPVSQYPTSLVVWNTNSRISCSGFFYKINLAWKLFLSYARKAIFGICSFIFRARFKNGILTWRKLRKLFNSILWCSLLLLTYLLMCSNSRVKTTFFFLF